MEINLSLSILIYLYLFSVKTSAYCLCQNIEHTLSFLTLFNYIVIKTQSCQNKFSSVKQAVHLFVNKIPRKSTHMTFTLSYTYREKEREKAAFFL